MTTKKEYLYIYFGKLEACDESLYALREQRIALLNDICERMNEVFVTEIQELGFAYVHFDVEDFEDGSEIVLRFEEQATRKDFDSEEEWMQYQCDNTELCYDFLEKIYSGLDIICIPIDMKAI